MAYIGDLVFVCVCLLFVIIGARRGFIKSAVHCLGAILSACLASLLGGAAAQWVFDNFFRQALAERIGESLASMGNGDALAAVQEVLSSLPDFLLRALESAGLTANSLADSLTAGRGQAAEMIAQGLSPVFVGFLKILAVIVLFFLFMIAVRALGSLLSTVFYLPVLSQVNALLGGVFGLLLAVVTVWIILGVLWVFTPLLPAETQTQLTEALEASYLLGPLSAWNPLETMFQ